MHLYVAACFVACYSDCVTPSYKLLCNAVLSWDIPNVSPERMM